MKTCWEFKKCNPERKNTCPAYPNRGNDCWRVTGTKCGGVEQGDVHSKLAMCRKCDYYNSGECQKA